MQTVDGDIGGLLSFGWQMVRSGLTLYSRHGKFRPTLMKLVSSNDPAFVKETVQQALERYKKTSDVAAAVATLAKLKGIGPATASLLLAVHDPQHVVFFADEAFHWLCCGGRKDPIKYNAKEYAALNERAQGLCRRLGVRAVDVERVAFVMLRQHEPASPPQSRGHGKSESKAATGGASGAIKKPDPGPAKRKASSEDHDDVKGGPPRRSKRRANET